MRKMELVIRLLRNMFRCLGSTISKVGMSDAIVTSRTSLRQLRDYAPSGVEVFKLMRQAIKFTRNARRSMSCVAQPAGGSR
jgi:hypothetical protein